ncbi:hypothetical protein FHR72_002474 [Mycolicibacterium iranicum]|uniref:Lipoprotein LpqN n=1 Tax=Mycolicibacterium iranicum TaxID=912594 RepID=A0A839QEZ5_MYCIR|nr:LpqN/LpqT family lipoprotein [Mycolicibacterium iranicum]MBB2991001.1 hypothetical protein [Mycolicibacterium iranicum]
MTIARRAGFAATAVALGIGLAACGSDTAGEATKADDTSQTAPESSATSSPAESAPPPASTPPAQDPGMTIEQYAEQNGITVAPVLPGDPGAPTITLPRPSGWEAAGDRAPEGAFDAIVYTGEPPSPTPPMIVARVVKLTGNVDQAKVLEYAPAETRSLPGYEGAPTGKKSTLGGYEATQIGGFYTRDGVTWLIAQKTAVVPIQDGVFVVKVTAEGTEDLAMPLMDATSAIDEQATITP